MSRQWVAGDVAMVRLSGAAHEFQATRYDTGLECGWFGGKGLNREGDAHFSDNFRAAGAQARRLIVIDAEDPEAVERLAGMVQTWLDRVPYSDMREPGDLTHVTAMQQALRTYASPEVEEPQGLGARVRAAHRDDEGRGFGPCVWTRAETGEWICLTDGYVGDGTSWGFLRDVEVLDA